MPDMRAINTAVIDEFRRSGGALSGKMAGRPILLLTTTGRTSGTPHTTPLVFVDDGGRRVVVASNGGARTEPDWYRNLLASPNATVEVGTITIDAVASVTAGTERARLFDQLTATFPEIADYVTSAGREIPVVVLAKAHEDG